MLTQAVVEDYKYMILARAFPSLMRKSARTVKAAQSGSI
jgi:hypothetical protein